MLPGKSYSPEEIIGLVLRRWWLFALTLVVGGAGAYLVSHRLVDMYRSETTILVVPQRVPDTYVKSTVTATIEDRLPTIQQQILSRSRLEQIIVDLNLYPELRRTAVMEDVVQMMRDRDVTVGIDKSSTSFHVGYISSDPKIAQKVAEQLATWFIDENSRDRANQAEATNQFLDSELEAARLELVEQEKKVEEYKRQHTGQLPSQAQSNLQAIQSTQLQLQSLGDSINRDREQRLLVNRQLADTEAPDPLLVALQPTLTAGADTKPTTTQMQLEAAYAQMRLMEARLMPEHPERRAMQRNIEELEKKRAEEQKAAAQPNAPAAPVSPAEVIRDRRIRDQKAQLDVIDRGIADKEAQVAKLRAVVTDYQAKLDAMPARESELVEITRNYTTQFNYYQSLLTKRGDSNLAANLERKNSGEQFRVLDRARVPERPFKPNRQVIYLGGIGGGLGLALLIIGFLEYRDSSFKHESEVARLLELPVLALVPLIVSVEERRRQRRRSVLAGVSVAILVLAAAAAVFVLRPSL